MAFPSDRVRLNVGGELFETTTTTLSVAGRDSMLGALIDSHWNSPPSSGANSPPEYFLDRNPACFSVLLDLLRSGELHLPPSLPEPLLLREASFYGLLPLVRAARWGPLDGNRLRYSTSISGTAPGDGTSISASPSGGCCVAHGPILHVYDWTFVEQPPITLDYQRINSAAFLDPSHILLTARGMALFSSSSSELLHRFHVRHENQLRSFTAGALSFNHTDSKIFASCKGRYNEYGIGVWDQNSGLQTDFFYELPGCPVGDSDSLQWLDSPKCLISATLFPKTEHCYIALLDFREKNIVWSWTDTVGDDKRVLDVVAMEDNHSVCVVNQYDDLGFLDLRMNGGGVRWSSRSKLTKSKGRRNVNEEELCYPRLASHGGQLFLAMNDTISVFSGPEFVHTSTLRKSEGGAICDFSIGGDRLFALHSEENVFDVWETPPASSPML
ncbi:putative transcription factor WD40-like family [Dioscorea sansibarensis]